MTNFTKPRKMSGKRVTDEMILELILDGTITANLKTGQVFKNGNELTARPVAGGHGRNKIVEICIPKTGRQRLRRRRTIIRARLVYMIGTRKVIPAGHDIHHVRGKSDAFGNLVCVTESDHDKFHGRFKYPEDDWNEFDH